MDHERSSPTNPATTPDHVASASVTPQGFSHSEHSFTLQAVMELQKSTGQLTSSVDSLKHAIDKQDKKLSDIESTVTNVEKKIYAAIVVLTILVAVGGFVVNKSWDLMVKQITSQPVQISETPSTSRP